MKQVAKTLSQAVAALWLIAAVLPARAILYRYDAVLDGEWAANPPPSNPPDPMGWMEVCRVRIAGSAWIDYGNDFGQGFSGLRSDVTPIQLDLYFGAHYKGIFGSLTWWALDEAGYSEVHMSAVDGISFWGWLPGVTTIPESFAFTHYAGFRPPSTYYDYPFQIWTKDAWLFGEERVGPYALWLSNGRPVPDAGTTAALLALALGGMLGTAGGLQGRHTSVNKP